MCIRDSDWGRYLIRVYDPNGGHASGQTVFIDTPYSVSYTHLDVYKRQHI